MKNFFYLTLIILIFTGCSKDKIPNDFEGVSINPPVLDEERAEYLYRFAFECIDQEFPNKTGHVMGDSTSVGIPSTIHPAFYGCFDWHSSVHGHWTLVNLLNAYPESRHFEEIMEKLSNNLTRENIEQEVKYFDDLLNSNFERTYGWAWLLKLHEALDQWDHPEAAKMKENLTPLTLLIESKFISFLEKLNYPIRVGEHPNTAFGLSFALDYARSQGRKELESKIIEKAKEYYMNDAGCPLTWEPGGFDFLSPCLQEASLMLKVLPRDEFKTWMDGFLPGFLDNPQDYIAPAQVSDRADGKLAHLDGLNFSRAWCLYEIGKALENDKIMVMAVTHFNYSYDKIDSGEYAGTHWLASFALYALLKAQA